MLLGGVHGDEPVGTVLVDRLRFAFGLAGVAAETESDDVRGTLVLAYGNPVALRRCTRAAEGRRDLNRWFLPKDIGRAPSETDAEDLRRARALAPLLAAASYALDLHGSSSDSPPFLCALSITARHRALAPLFDVPYVLGDPHGFLAADLGLREAGTTDGWVGRHGGCGFGYETGRQDDFSRAEIAWAGVRRFLVATGVLAPEADERCFGLRPAPPAAPPVFYELLCCTAAEEDGFRYLPGRNQGWTPVRTGEPIGQYPSRRLVCAGMGGLLVFPKAPRLVRRGENLFYVAAKT